MVGHDSIGAGIAAFFSNLHGIQHTLPHWRQPAPDVVIVEFTTTYIRLKATKVTLNASAVFQLRDEKIANYHVYTDLTPVFAA